jgi:hypothetical protein
VEGAVIAWEGHNPWTRENGGILRLYHAVYANPRPEMTVNRLECRSALMPAAPFLIAVTAE